MVSGRSDSMAQPAGKSTAQTNNRHFTVFDEDMTATFVTIAHSV